MKNVKNNNLQYNIKAQGSKKSIAANHSPKGRRKNRRIKLNYNKEN